MRKGVSAKRPREDAAEPVAAADNRAPEQTIAATRPRRARISVNYSELALEPKEAKDQVEAQIWQSRPTAQFLESVCVPRLSSGAVSGILQPITGALNSTAVAHRAAKNSLSAEVPQENVVPHLGKRKRAAVPAPSDDGGSEFETPPPSSEGESEYGTSDPSGDESDFDDPPTDSDAYSDASASRQSTKGKARTKVAKATFDIFRHTTKKLQKLNVSAGAHRSVKIAAAIKGAPRSKWTPETINELPPLSSIQDIFFDLTKRNKSLVEVSKHLNDRPLRVATMCSGTESPLLALGLITTHLKSIFGAEMKIDHVFSCEIEPWKQAYIERNFQPPILFRDVCELGEEYATTAYGAKVKVPGDCDLLVAGTSCVDYSSLNNFGKGLNDGGESGRTFWGMFSWVQKHRPKIVILENVCKAPWGQVVTEFEGIGYAAGHTRFDTKNYYIPHTRQRGYLVAFNTDNGVLPATWVQMVNDLTRPASVSFESFLLESDDPRVLEARQKLIREETSKAKAHEWTACEIRHTNARTSENLGRQRPLTDWQESGTTKYPDFTWQEWGGMQVDRVNDLLDISYLRNVKKGMDISYKARLWNLSQNVDRDTEGKSGGISQCLTPTMIPYLTARGGPMIGVELLSLQGLPVEQLLLTRETEANLKDLAGNAMSSTVVGTAIVAALITGKKLLEGSDLKSPTSTSTGKHAEKPLVALPTHQTFSNLDLAGSSQLRVKDLLKIAMRSARMCVCEGRSLISTHTAQICDACGHRSCTKCGGKPTHMYHPLNDIQRMPPNIFENGLKEMLPMTVKFEGGPSALLASIQRAENLPIKNKDWSIWQKHASEALSSTLTFKAMKRQEIWLVEYESPRAKLHLILDPAQVEWRLYVKIDWTSAEWKQLRRLFAGPIAQMFMKTSGNSLLQGSWRIGVPGVAFVNVNVQGQGELVDSWEKSVGLVESSFANKMVYSELHLSLGDPSQASLLDEDITGKWELLPKCGTANRALHRKSGNDDSPLFLFLDPNRLGDHKSDSFVISRSCKRIAFGEHRSIVARFDAAFRPSTANKAIKTQLNLNVFWVSAEDLELMPSTRATAQYSYASPATIATHTACDLPAAFLVCSAPLTPALANNWPTSWQVVDDARAEETFSSINWLVERMKLGQKGSDWLPYTLKGNHSCPSCAPPKPKILWGAGRNRSGPIEDPEESAIWERAMKARPAPWVTALKKDSSNTLHLHIGLNLVSLCHRAVDLLPSGIGLGSLLIVWKLTSDYINPPRLILPDFKVRSNRPDPQSSQPPGFALDLRPEQLRSLSWMRAQESDDAEEFIEEEIVEALHPQLSWKVAVKATRPNNAKGGVLADAVGYGKTAIILGLLAHTKNRYVPPVNTHGRIPLKATLIVVPGHLSNQWEAEVRKFTGKLFKVINIKTVNNLISCSIKNLMEADIVIVAGSLFKSNAYLQRLAELSSCQACPTAGGRRFQDWLRDVTEGLKAQAERMQSGRAAEAIAVVTEGCKERQEAKSVEKEERLLGRKAHNEAARSRSNNTNLQSSDADDFDDEPARKKSKTTAAEKEPSAYDERRWKLKFSGKTNWKNTICPPLELFHFNRLVLDEFTYCVGMPLEVIPNLLATYRWVLSGTPPMGDFADIKKVAKFLGILLGIDDDTANSEVNNKKIAKERSAVESFQAFKELRTAAWHQDRHSHAQGFLNQFMRQNIAEIDEIPWEEHFIRVKLPAAERAIYIELDHHLKALDMNVTRKGYSKGGGDREARLHSAIGGSSSAEEALLKSCCHFSLNIENLSEDASAYSACDAIIEERTRQLENNQDELINFLQDGLLITKRLRREVVLNSDLPFLKYLEDKRKHSLDDKEATDLFRELLQRAKTWADSHVKTNTVPSILANFKPTKSKADDEDEDDADDENPRNKSNKVSSGQPEVDSVALLKTIQHQVSRLLKELVGRCRSLRFFKLVRQVQHTSGKSKAHTSIWPGDTCICGKKQPTIDQVIVSSSCGHSACADCMATAAGLRNECPRKPEGCQSRVLDASLIRVSSLGADNDTITTHGAKLDALVELLKTDIPSDERVLVFIQFPDLLKKVEYVLQDAGVTVTRLSGSSRAKSSDLAYFQSDKSTRVLLLEVMGETAAGANLTMANHVVFLSPLLAIHDQQYQATETQAIGRARRYGQKKTVHIWRLVVEDTIDFQIYAERGNPVPDLSQ
ncbi:DNA repair protein RAD5 [Drechslerella dactyloides]|uniref:DNA repair protein RAD5 n=1 Tax=Drechslerella dactyloides TaxID=74499 RepID=A0AAD6IZR2_DREDA|nr:DNA repair protein RAD5 [Drechslerella dactyloides]